MTVQSPEPIPEPTALLVTLAQHQVRMVADAIEASLDEVAHAARTLAEPGPSADADARFTAHITRVISTLQQVIATLRADSLDN